MGKTKYEMVCCIVNAGYSGVVMDAARSVGVSGGTVLAGRGTVNKEAEKLFSITVQPEKDMVIMIVPSDIKDDVLRAIYRDAGLRTDGQGIAFSLPVNDTVGLDKNT